MSNESVKVNLADKTQFEAMPEGYYLVKVTEAEWSKTKKNDPMLKVTLSVQGGDYDNRKLFENFTIKPECLWMLEQFGIATGYCEEDAELDITPNELIGLECYVDVINEEQTFTNRKGVEVTQEKNIIKEYSTQ
jgi:hypothetical protein